MYKVNLAEENGVGEKEGGKRRYFSYFYYFSSLFLSQIYENRTVGFRWG